MPVWPVSAKALTLVVLLGICALRIDAQERYDYTWMLGYSNETVSDTIWWMSKLDFNTSPATVNVVDGRSDMDGQAATISDPEDGRLLFYGNGCHIRNAEYEMMVNGDSIVLTHQYEGFCFAAGLPPQDGMMILPDPGNEQGYWVFNQGVTKVDKPFSLFAILFIAYVDMSLDEGRGAVTLKQMRLGNDSLFTGLSAYRHANDRDWWIIIGKDYSHTFFKILIDEFGVHWQDTVHINSPLPVNKGSGGGQTFFSPDGKLFFQLTGPDDLLYVMDFDRETGDVSNLRTLSGWDTDGLFGGASISPSGQFLYINNGIKVWQMDLWDPDTTTNFELIAEWDEYIQEHGVGAGFGTQRLGPDCRLYIAPTTWSRYVHTILYPDRKGADCGFRQRYIRTPAYIGYTLPNFPYYRIGTDYPLCDSTHQGFVPVSVTDPGTTVTSSPLALMPNPFTHSVQVYAGDELIPPGTMLSVYDGVGRLIHREPVVAQMMGLLTVDWPTGSYYFTWIPPSGPPRYATGLKVE